MDTNYLTECRLSAPVKARLVHGSKSLENAGDFSYMVRYEDWTIPVEQRKDVICGLIYKCPGGCGKEGYVAFKPPSEDDIKYGRDTWTWDGNREAPTLSPSIHNHDVIYEGKKLAEQPTHWHGWLQNGFFVQA